MSSSATTSLIQAVLQASKRTFARSRNRFKLKEEDFVSSLRDLKCLLDNVRTHDLGKQKKKNCQNNVNKTSKLYFNKLFFNFENLVKTT